MSASTLVKDQRIRARFFTAAGALVYCLVFTAAASADHSFCPSGSGAGQCGDPQGVAVDEVSGDVYVADDGNDRVNVFDSAGNFRFAWGYGVADGTTPVLQRCGPEATPPTTTCFKGISGSGPGQFGSPKSIAVDNDVSSPSYRDIYVGSGNFRVQRFDREGNFLIAFGSAGSGPGQFIGPSNPIAVGPGGAIYVADSPSGSGTLNHQIKRFDSTGAFLGSCEVPELAPPVPSQAQPFEDIAVDSSGNFYVVYGVGFGIFKYEPSEPTCTHLDSLDSGDEIQTRALSAVDSSGDIFAYQSIDDIPLTFITKYDTSGATQSRFGYGALKSRLEGLASRSATGDLFASESPEGNPLGIRVLHLSAPPPGPIVVPASVTADSIGNAKATVRATINPEGKETTYHFDYVDQKGFEESGFSGPTVKSTPESAAVGSGGDFGLYEASAQIGCLDPTSEIGSGKCLTPSTTYRFRVIAKNEDGKGNGPQEGTFTTKPPLEIEAAWSTDIGTESATLSAEVNPLGIPTTGYFQYVDNAKYKSSGFTEAVEVPDVGGGSNPLAFGAGESPVVRSVQLSSLVPGVTYHYRILAIDSLLTDPIVGPERTFITFSTPSGANTDCPNQAFRTGPSASLPDCRAYEMVSPVDKGNGDALALININGDPAGLDQSALSGEKLTFSAYRSFGDAESSPYTSQYIATRGEDGWSVHGISPPRGINFLGPGFSLESQYKAFSPDLCKGWLIHDTDPPLASGAVEGFTNIYRRDNCDGESYAALTTAEPPNIIPKEYTLELQGVSGDGTTAIFLAKDKLTSNAVAGKKLVYEAVNGSLRLVCVLPNGTASKSGCTAGTAPNSSTSGRYRAVDNAISEDGSRIFWTASEEGPGQIYARIDRKTTVAVGSGQFWSAAADGSVALFTDGSLESSAAHLRTFDLDEKETHSIAGKVAGVLGASEDASRIYFASEESLADGAVAGRPNLYLYEAGEGEEDGTFAFVATLSDGDTPGFTPGFNRSPLDLSPIRHTARVSADGLHAVFMSEASPTGYDNADRESGKADAEVYLYDAGASGGAGELICASCNPSGARPTGREVKKSGTVGPWVASQIPGWANQLYATRVLSTNGNRLFFESFDSLVLRDTNGKMDVYQWEAAGSGDCTEAASAYSPPNQGCLSLISSGQSAQDTEFVDASPNGEDVFIRTEADLLPQDDGLVDIYDARAGGGYPPPPVPSPSCEGEACQGPLAVPDDPTPASSTFHGAGNVSEPPPARKCAKGRRAVRKAGKTRCLKKSQKGKAQRRRNRGRAR